MQRPQSVGDDDRRLFVLAEIECARHRHHHQQLDATEVQKGESLKAVPDGAVADAENDRGEERRGDGGRQISSGERKKLKDRDDGDAEHKPPEFSILPERPFHCYLHFNLSRLAIKNKYSSSRNPVVHAA